MFTKKKKQEAVIIEDNDENFEIFQEYRADEHIAERRKFRPTQVASPYFGTHVADKKSFIDNSGYNDVDDAYDYLRDEEAKHLSKEDVIKKHGSEYYEFQILDNEKLKEIGGGEYDDSKLQKIKPKQVNRSTMLDSLIASNVDELDIDDDTNSNTNDDISFDSNLEQMNTENDEPEFKIHIDLDEDIEDEPKDFSFNGYDESLDKPKQANIPSFLIKNEKEEKDNDREALKQIKNDVDSSDLSFDNVPNLKTPNLFFDDDVKKPDLTEEQKNYKNPAVSKEMSIEDAIRMSKGGTVVPGHEGENTVRGLDNISRVSKPKEDISLRNNAQEMNSMPKPEPKKEAPKPKVEVNKYKNYKVPYKKLFPKSDGNIDLHPQWLEEKKTIINETLKAFGIDGEVVAYTKGPAFTLYEVGVATGVNVKKFGNIVDNLKMVLKAPSIRLQIPIPGKATVGIEAPNDKADVVKFGDICSDSFLLDGKPLNVVLGKNIDGTPVYENITSMPHCLIAGATQSGKSVCINTILCSLITKNSPEQLKLILVDPKKVEMSFYEDIPHLATPVLTEPDEAGEALKWACTEMDRRYMVFQRNRVRNIGDYIQKQKDHPELNLENLPYYVIIVDEFNDLIMQCGSEVNDSIVRLGQKARACGIHVILATQRPTADIVNGTIKANFPCRIAFRVASSVDSSVILDETGAEELLGRGDMIIKNNGNPIRAQGAYISDSEIEGICSYLTTSYEPDYVFTHEELRDSLQKSQGGASGGSSSGKANSESEELIESVARFCVDGQACSINAIQNQFGLGFNSASRVVAILEERGIVSPKAGTKPRDILVDSFQLDQIFGSSD